MLPVYDAVSYEGTMSVGRTEPWIIMVDTGTDYKPFVVKMFTSQEVAKRDCVSKEVFGNVLAPQFDLPVPMAALINIGKEFEKTL